MKLPSMPLFVDDFEAATTHLTLEEDGAYNRLLRLCWRTPGCSIPDESAWIMRRMRVDQSTYDSVVAPLIDEFFTREKGRIFQKRQREEFGYVTRVSEARKEAGKQGGFSKSLKYNKKTSSKARNLPEQNLSKTLAPTPTPINNKYGDFLAGIRGTIFLPSTSDEYAAWHDWARKKGHSLPNVNGGYWFKSKLPPESEAA